jgi:flagellar biosynthesis regulator FlbT
LSLQQNKPFNKTPQKIASTFFSKLRNLYRRKELVFMEKYFEALREYCEEYSFNQKSEHTGRLREIYWIARHAKLEPEFYETNIVGLATRLSGVLDFRKEGDKEFVRKRQLAA